MSHEIQPERAACPVEEGAHNWTFLTNHAHVLLCLSREHHDTLREVSQCVGITERAVQRIVADLESAGIIARERIGRRNRYKVNTALPLRHDLEAHKTVGDLMAMVLRKD